MSIAISGMLSFPPLAQGVNQEQEKTSPSEETRPSKKPKTITLNTVEDLVQHTNEALSDLETLFVRKPGETDTVYLNRFNQAKEASRLKTHWENLRAMYDAAPKFSRKHPEQQQKVAAYQQDIEVRLHAMLGLKPEEKDPPITGADPLRILVCLQMMDYFVAREIYPKLYQKGHEAQVKIHASVGEAEANQKASEYQAYLAPFVQIYKDLRASHQKAKPGSFSQFETGLYLKVLAHTFSQIGAHLQHTPQGVEVQYDYKTGGVAASAHDASGGTIMLIPPGVKPQVTFVNDTKALQTGLVPLLFQYSTPQNPIPVAIATQDLPFDLREVLEGAGLLGPIQEHVDFLVFSPTVVMIKPQGFVPLGGVFMNVPEGLEKPMRPFFPETDRVVFIDFLDEKKSANYSETTLYTTIAYEANHAYIHHLRMSKQYREEISNFQFVEREAILWQMRTLEAVEKLAKTKGHYPKMKSDIEAVRKKAQEALGPLNQRLGYAPNDQTSHIEDYRIKTP